MLERLRRGWRSWNVGAVLVVALFMTCRSGAQELGPTLLSYRVPEGCPTAADFQRSVQSRSARVRFVEQGAHDRELSIAMHKDGDFMIGALRLIEGDGSLRKRNVRFSTCAEAVEGLALIAVVSLDPQALLRPQEAQQSTASPAPAASAPTVASASAAAPVRVPPAQPKQAPVPLRRPTKLRLALGGEFNWAPFALPATALGGTLFADFASRSESALAPLFRAAISHVERRGLSAGAAADANFTLTLATLSACPLHFAGGGLALRPCAFVSGGALYAWGSGTTNPEHSSRPYGALGGSVLVFAHASQAIDIVADLAVGGSLLRDRFGIAGAEPWRTPALYLSTGIGTRFVFP